MNFDDIMAFNAPYNEENLNKLIRKIENNSVIPYIGAGMSMLSKNVYPSWNNFLNNLVEKYIEENQINLYKQLDYEEKAGKLYSEMGGMTFSDKLEEAFGENSLEGEDIDLSQNPIYTLPSIFDKGLLLTTNYDKVIEKIYKPYNKVLTVQHPGHFEALNSALRDETLLLFKIHGDIIEKSSIVITKEQYDSVYKDDSLRQSLKQIYASKSMLFLGCSMIKDRPIEFLCKNSTPGMSNFAIISCKSDCKKNRRKELENNYFTQAILYPEGEHNCVKIVLDYIAKEIDKKSNENNKNKFFVEKTENVESILNEEWFTNQNKIQIKNMGERYLPDLNIELNLKRVFDALSRNKYFINSFYEKADKLLIALKNINLIIINDNIKKIYNIVNEFDFNSIQSLDTKDIINEVNIISELIRKKIKEIYKKLNNKNCKENISIDNNLYRLRETSGLLRQYENYLNSIEINAFNNPYILLHGEGGIGKSHIIADTVCKRNSEGKKSLLFLGQQFNDEDKNPLVSMLNILGLRCSSKELLTELNKIGEKDKSRVIIFVDALNEGKGKHLWKNYLAGILEEIKLFPWLGLVVSIRTEYMESLFVNNSIMKNEFVEIKHQGFSTLEYTAIKKYFDFYNMKFLDIPFAEQEFRNPLFLRLLCEGFKNKSINLSNISITDVYKNYLASVNLSISENCEFSKHINIVEKSIKNLVVYKYDIGSGDNFIPLDKAVEIITDMEKKYNIKKSLLDELLSSGIITKTIVNSNEEYIYITYEKLDDYLYAKLLANELSEIGINQFRIKYEKLKLYGDILEALAIVISENGKYELFDIFGEEKQNPYIINSFCNSLKWRKSYTISPNTMQYINDIVLKSEDAFRKLFDILLLISLKTDHCLNTEYTINCFLEFSMPDRDGKYNEIFDSLYMEEGSSINRLLDWCLLKKTTDNVLEDTVKLAANTLAMFLISPNNSLRDRATKAMINLLKGKIDILICVLERYEDVDDPYITERLYAVAFACIVSEQKSNKIEALAKYIYNIFFKNENVYPNILMRDYAKNIIEYAKYRCTSTMLSTIDIRFPYKSEMPKVPTDDEIEKYKYDYNSPNFKDKYISQNTILNSMEVEYTRNGRCCGYGDFGRYTFQSYFSNWEFLDYNDLKNIAIKKIFDMGYDVEKHGEYDSIVSGKRFRNNSIERIGKKYQWIALYELAAQVADNYKMIVYTDCNGGKEKMYCKGSFEPNLRNIDPTALSLSNNDKNRNKHEELFKFSSLTNNEWTSDFDDFPDINELIILKYKDTDYILLNGWYNWKEEKKLGYREYQNPTKNMWAQINCYITKNTDYYNVVKYLKDKDFIGRWLPESNNNYCLYNKEYYWSDAYHFYINPYYCGNDWKVLDESGRVEKSNLKVLIPSSIYTTERNGDNVNDGSVASWYKPCGELFKSLDMKYGQENSVLYDLNGNMICFDSKEIINEDIGFFINKELFLDFLEEHNYKAVWTILSEKIIISGDRNFKKNYKQPRISGVYTFEEECKLKGEFKTFID